MQAGFRHKNLWHGCTSFTVDPAAPPRCDHLEVVFMSFRRPEALDDRLNCHAQSRTQRVGFLTFLAIGCKGAW